LPHGDASVGHACGGATHHPQLQAQRPALCDQLQQALQRPSPLHALHLQNLAAVLPTLLGNRSLGRRRLSTLLLPLLLPSLRLSPACRRVCRLPRCGAGSGRHQTVAGIDGGPAGVTLPALSCTASIERCREQRVPNSAQGWKGLEHEE
jgi:hypothetical protein